MRSSRAERHRRARHAGQLLVAEEEVLHGDPRRLARGHGHLDALLGLDRLVDAVAPLAALGQPAGELVDDHDLAVADDVLPVEVILAVDLDRPLDVLVDVEHADRVHGLGLGQHADLLAALAGQLDRLLLVVVLVVLVLDELVDHRGAPLVALDGQLLLLGRQGADDQRRAGFVDQDAVGLVDQGEVRLALDRFLVGRPSACWPSMPPSRSVWPSPIRRSSSRSRRKSKPNSLAVP